MIFHSSWSWRQRGVFLLMASLVLVLIIDLALELRADKARTLIEAAQPVRGQRELLFTSELTLVDLDRESDRGTLAATIDLKVTAEEPEVDICTVSLSLQSKSGARKWSHFCSQKLLKPRESEEDPCLGYQEFCRPENLFGGEFEFVPGENEPEVSQVELGATFAVDLLEDGNDLFYPFDSDVFHLEAWLCVNDPKGEGCLDAVQTDLQTPGLTLASFRDDLVLRSIDAATGRAELVLERESFVRWICVFFLVVVALFLTHLLTVGDAGELLAKALGLFGALWALRQLIVPKSLETFPTIVDYSLFVIYSLVFSLIIIKVQSK